MPLAHLLNKKMKDCLKFYPQLIRNWAVMSGGSSRELQSGPGPGPGPAGTGTGTGTKIWLFTGPGPGPGLKLFYTGPGQFFMQYIFTFIILTWLAMIKSKTFICYSYKSLYWFRTCLQGSEFLKYRFLNTYRTTKIEMYM